MASTAAMCAGVSAEQLSGQAVVIDGDTLEVGGRRIRLHGIDAPETAQRCVDEEKKIVRPAEESIRKLSELSAAGLLCAGAEYDDYGRLIATCRTSTGLDVAERLVEEGLAWAFVRYSNDYSTSERKAKVAAVGVWSMRCEAPWDFRAKRWRVATQKAPAGCPIKGNISGNGKVYHLPWNRHYSTTRIDVSKGERWFCNEKEAADAGWRPARQ